MAEDGRFVVYVVPGADEPRQSFRRYRAVAAALLVSAAVVALAASRCGRMAALATLRCVRACVRICVPADGAGAVCWLTARPLAVLQPRQRAAGGDGGSAGRTGSRDGAEGAGSAGVGEEPQPAQEAAVARRDRQEHRATIGLAQRRRCRGCQHLQSPGARLRILASAWPQPSPATAHARTPRTHARTKRSDARTVTSAC